MLLDALDDEVGALAERRVASSVMVAVAALETVAGTPPGDDRREPALLIAVTLGQEAATTARAGSEDQRLLRCADACERAASVCQAELDARRP